MAYTKSDILEFLRKNPIMNISVVSGTKPLASVVLFAVEDDFTFYFASHTSSFKTKALLKDPQISFSVWKHLNMLVQVDGIAHKAGEVDVNSILEKLAKSSISIEDFWPPLLRTGSDHYTVFVIKPTWLRILDLKSVKINEEKSPFQEISLI